MAGCSTVVLAFVKLLTNEATINGGGLHTYMGSNPSLTNVTFTGNRAISGGGGMYNDHGQPQLDQCHLLWQQRP